MVKLLAIFFIASVVFIESHAISMDLFQSTFQPAVDKLINEAQKAVNSAQTTSQKLLDSASAATQLYHSTLQKNIENAFAKTNETIHAAYDKAYSLGGNARACVVEKEGEIKDFTTSQFDYLTGCLTEKIFKAINISQNLMSDSKNMIGLVSNFTDVLNNKCPKPVNTAQMMCTGGVIAETTIKTAEIAADITKNVAGGMILIQSLATIQVDLPACLTLRTGEIGLKSLPLVAAITKCTISKTLQ